MSLLTNTAKPAIEAQPGPGSNGDEGRYAWNKLRHVPSYYGTVSVGHAFFSMLSRFLPRLVILIGIVR